MATATYQTQATAALAAREAATAQLAQVARDVATTAVNVLLEQLRNIEDPVLRYRVCRAVDAPVKNGVSHVSREAARELRAQGVTLAGIGAEFGISHQAVSRLLSEAPRSEQQAKQ